MQNTCPTRAPANAMHAGHTTHAAHTCAFDDGTSAQISPLATATSRAMSAMHTTEMHTARHATPRDDDESRTETAPEATPTETAPTRRNIPTRWNGPTEQPTDEPNTETLDLDQTAGPEQTAARTFPPDPWSEADVRLLPKEQRPTLFRLLGPITVLAVRAKANTQAVLRACNPFDVNPYEATLGFRKRYQCAEVKFATRLLIERSLEWQTTLFFAQLGFAKAYDCHAVFLGNPPA